jgi:hypothetical protein
MTGEREVNLIMRRDNNSIQERMTEPKRRKNGAQKKQYKYKFKEGM